MKIMFLICLFSSLRAWSIGMPAVVRDYFVGDPEEICKKLYSDEKSPCSSFVKKKVFRKDFLAVCFDVQKAMDSSKGFECLRKIESKNSISASRSQAETCQEIVNSKNFSWVKRCLDSNVTEELGQICANYTNTSHKGYYAALNCVESLNSVSTSDLDMSHVRGLCKKIMPTSDFSGMANCLSNAEMKSKTGSGDSRIKERFQESSAQK